MSAGKIIKISAITVASLFVTVVIVAIGFYLWLTPARLSSIISKESGKYINAEVKTEISGFSLFSTFPWFCLHADSLAIISHIPSGKTSGSTLLSSGPLSFSLNIPDILKGKINLRDISISKPCVNIIVVNDSIANYSILRKTTDKIKVPAINIEKVNISSPATLSYNDLRNHTDARLIISGANIKPTIGKAINADMFIDGSLSAHSGSFNAENPIPFSVNGNIRVSSSPVLISTQDLVIDIAGISSTISMDYDQDSNLPLQHLNAEVSIPDLKESILSLPACLIDKIPYSQDLISSLKGRLILDSKLALKSPYNPDSKEMPNLFITVSLQDSDLELMASSNRSINVDSLKFLADIDIDPQNPESSNIKVNDCYFSTPEFKEVSLVADVSGILTKNPSIVADLNMIADLTSLPSLMSPTPNMKLKGKVKTDTHIEASFAFGPYVSLQGINAAGSLSSPFVSVKEGNSSTAMTGMNLGYKLKGNQASSDLEGDLELIVDNIKSGNNRNLLSANDIVASFDVKSRKNPFSSSSELVEYTSPGDSMVASKVAHSPLFLSPSFPSMLQTVLSMTDIKSSVKASSGQLSATGFPLKNTFSNLDLYATSDSIVINNADVTSGNSSGEIKGNISGLRSFICSPSSSPVSIDLYGYFDNININDLCLAYYKGQEALTGIPADFNVPPMGKPVKADSLCIAIPRNIDARVRLASSKAEYMGYTFSPLSTELSMKDGVARIGNLSIGSQFADARLDWIYSTADLDSIHMDLKLDVDNFDIPRFMYAFPSLHTKAPVLNEFSGSLSLNAEGSFLIFPDMEINPPSMEAVADLKSDSLMIARNDDKIRHYTHLMLIKGDTPVAVENLDIHSSFHDNFLQVDPFFIKAAGYEVQVAGVNNLQSEIYYHMGLFRNPLHMPFGVNIVGNFHHPEIRFGGKSVKDGREREISANINDDVEVNIMQWLKHGWMQFVAAAAKYEHRNNQTAYSDVH